MARLDLLDLDIVREIVLGHGDSPRTDRASAEQIAKSLQVHPNTVAARIRRLRENEAFLPMSVQLAPSPFGLELAHVFFPVPVDRRTRDLREYVRGLAGLHYFIQYLEGWTLALYAPNLPALRALVTRVERRLAVTAQWDLLMSRDASPLARASVDDLDVRILAVLLADSRMEAPGIAALVGRPVRTVRRRIERLFANQWVRYLPGGADKLSGLAFGYVRMELPATRNRARIVDDMQPNVRRALSGRVFERMAHFWTYDETLATLQDRMEALRKIEGVPKIEHRIMEAFEQHAGVARFLALWIGSPAGPNSDGSAAPMLPRAEPSMVQGATADPGSAQVRLRA